MKPAYSPHSHLQKIPLPLPLGFFTLQPMKFSDIVGQEPLKQRLKRTVLDNRVSHAQLFLGPEGSGKLALALAYAQYINCRRRTPEDSCGECPSCKKYSKLIHPDLHFIYPINKTKEVDDKNVLSKDFIVPLARISATEQLLCFAA